MYNYSLRAFGSMINAENRHRVAAYAQALRQSITPDSVVLEIGAGIGFFSILACRYGARHVYAVEPNDLVHLGRAVAEANGVAERITFIQGLSTAIDLPERADVIVSDIRGVLPWLADHIPSIQDARERLLKPGGVLIPTRDTVWAAVAHHPRHYSRQFDAWDQSAYEIDLDVARRRAVNSWGKGHVKPENLLTEPKCWATLDYATITAENAEADIHWSAEQAGVGHGLSVWFESDLIPGVRMSNAPADPHNPIYSQAFFPWAQPVDLAAGDDIRVKLQTKRIDNKYEWVWRTRVSASDGETKADFRQSTFDLTVWSPQTLLKRSPGYVPQLPPASAVDHFILGQIDGQRSAEAIAQAVVAHFPKRSANPKAALKHVGDVIERYC